MRAWRQLADLRHAGRPCEQSVAEAGFAGGVEGFLFGLLIFVVGTLLVASAWGVLDTKLAADAAARQAVRTFVEASGPQRAMAAARQAADATLSGYGRDPADAQIDLVSGQWGRCQRVTIAVSYPAPMISLPLIGRVSGVKSVRAEHSELVDPYRTGLAGAAACP